MATRAVSTVVTYRAWDTSANAYKTGDSANHTLRWVKDGTSSATTNSPSEVDSTNAPGVYKVTLTATETDCVCGSLVGKSSTANIVLFGVQLGFEYIPNAAAGASGGLLISGSNSGTTTLGALTVTGALTVSNGIAITCSTANRSAITATGNGTGSGAIFTSGSGATGDGVKMLSASTNGSGLTATKTGTGKDFNAATTNALQVDLDTIKTQTVTCSGGVTIPAATLASTTNITAASGITVSTNSDKTGYSLSGTQTFNVTGNITGNLSGSVGSVTGAINTASGTIQTLDALDTAQDTQHSTTLSKLLKYFQLLLRKDSAIATDNATELTAINADGGSGAGSYSNTTGSTEAIRDRGDSAWITATGFSTLTAGDIRTAVGLASANLDTQLADLPTVSEFEARTIASANYATASAQTTAQNDLDTITGSDGVTLATTQGNYAPAKAGDAMALTSTYDAAKTAASASDVNAQVADVLSTDTYGEPSIAPGATVSLASKIGYLYMVLRNQMTVTNSAKTFHDDAGAPLWSKALSDDGTTYTEAEGS